MPKNQLLIDALHPSGAGLAEHEGTPVLVPGALPGETVLADWTPPKPGGRFGLANHFTQLAPSPLADPERCKIASLCGGCPAGRLRYEAELELKTRLLLTDPLKNAGFSVTPDAPVGQPQEARRFFRNKAILHPAATPEGLRFGMFRARSHEVIPAEDCPQTPVWMAAALKAAAKVFGEAGLSLYNETTGEGLLRAVLLRDGTEGRLFTPVVASFAETPLATLDAQLREAFEQDELLAGRLPLILWRENTEPGNAVPGRGRSWSRSGIEAIHTKVLDDCFAVGADTFLQVNSVQMPSLYRMAIDFLDPKADEDVMDLYCGVGTITLALGRRARRVMGVEVNPASVANAKENAKHAGLAESVCFETGLVEAVLPKILDKGFHPVKAVIDPAFRGIEASVAKALGRSGLRRLVYVSCNPQSFVRDAVRLEAEGFRLTRIGAVDMFPGALHLEAVGCFERA